MKLQGINLGVADILSQSDALANGGIMTRALFSCPTSLIISCLLLLLREGFKKNGKKNLQMGAFTHPPTHLNGLFFVKVDQLLGHF